MKGSAQVGVVPFSERMAKRRKIILSDYGVPRVHERCRRKQTFAQFTVCMRIGRQSQSNMGAPSYIWKIDS